MTTTVSGLPMRILMRIPINSKYYELFLLRELCWVILNLKLNSLYFTTVGVVIGSRLAFTPHHRRRTMWCVRCGSGSCTGFLYGGEWMEYKVACKSLCGVRGTSILRWWHHPCRWQWPPRHAFRSAADEKSVVRGVVLRTRKARFPACTQRTQRNVETRLARVFWTLRCLRKAGNRA